MYRISLYQPSKSPQFLTFLGTVFLLKLGHVKLPGAALVVHVADFSKNWPFCPALVMDPTDGPHAACGE